MRWFRKREPDSIPLTRGELGEQLARQFLEKKGYRFVAANWRCKGGEIDLLMMDGETLVVAEVKLRAPTQYGSGADVVASDKQRKLILAAQVYQQQENYWGDIRFDVVAITFGHGVQEIEHVEYAFEAP